MLRRSAYSWSGTSFTAAQEALIEEIRGDGPIGAGMSTDLAFNPLVESVRRQQVTDMLRDI